MSLSKAITISEKGLTFDIVRRSGLFPPIDVLNSFLQCGVDDAGSEVTIEWEPFSLDSDEYSQFLEHCKDSFGRLFIDGLTHDNFSDWFSAAVDVIPLE